MGLQGMSEPVKSAAIIECGHDVWQGCRYARKGSVRDRLNTVLHRQMGVWTPCQTACTHVIDGEWTALGAANVLARHSDENGRHAPGGDGS